jgi:hypothetical protein
MQFNKGDRVKFLNDTGGGIITGIKDSRSAIVLIDDGFDVPVPLSELILVKKSDSNTSSAHEKFNESDERKNDFIEETKSPSAPDDEDDYESRLNERNLFMAFVENSVNNNVEAWLINDSSLHVLYVVYIRQDDIYVNLKTGLLEADTKVFIKDFTREEINSFFSLKVQALFFGKAISDPLPPSQKEFPVDPSDLFAEGSFGINDFFNQKARIVPMISDAFEREMQLVSRQEIENIILKERESGKPAVQKVKIDPLVDEVDLHIEELVDDHSQLSGREVLELQMARFTTALEGAIRSKTRRIVFIHGVGNGKLKFEIRKTLDRKYPGLKYQDASFEEYGYGATMVIVRR